MLDTEFSNKQVRLAAKHCNQVMIERRKTVFVGHSEYVTIELRADGQVRIRAEITGSHTLQTVASTSEKKTIINLQTREIILDKTESNTGPRRHQSDDVTRPH